MDLWKFLGKHGHIFFIVLFVVISLLYPGYQVLVSDQKIYLPQAINQDQTILQEQDLLYSFRQIQFTIFDEFILLVKNSLSIDLFEVLFAISMMTRFFFFYSLYRIAYFFTRQRIFSTFTPLLFINGLAVFGTATTTTETELHPRMIALVLSLLFLACYLNKKRILSTLFLGLAISFHAITAVPFFVYYYVHLMLHIRTRVGKSIIRQGILSILIILPLFFLLGFLAMTVREGVGMTQRIDPVWESMVRQTSGYIFLTSWDRLSFLHVLSAGIFFTVCFVERKRIFDKEKLQHLGLLLGIPVLLSLGFFVFTESFHLFAAFQLYRSLVILKILLSMAFAYYAFLRIFAKPQQILMNFLLLWIVVSMIISEALLFILLPLLFLLWAKELLIKRGVFISNRVMLTVLGVPAVVVLLVNIMLLGITVAIYGVPRFLGMSLIVFALSAFGVFAVNKRKVAPIVRNAAVVTTLLSLFLVASLFPVNIYPKPSSDPVFKETCAWIEQHTSQTSLFLAEPFSSVSAEIRLLCKRAVYFADHDGAQSVFHRGYALEWHRRNSLVQLLQDNATLKLTLQNEAIDFVISERPIRTLNEDEAFANEKYFIYKVGG